MEEKRSTWKDTLNYGIILGLIMIVVSVITYMTNIMFEQWMSLLVLALNFVVLFFLLRSYRDHYNRGFISYGRSVGAGVVISLYAAILTAIFTYVLYAFIDPGLIEKSLQLAETKMTEKGVPEAALEQAMAVQAKMMKPWLMSLSSILNGVFFGLIMSLIVSLFIMKKGNPLLDDTEEGATA